MKPININEAAVIFKNLEHLRQSEGLDIVAAYGTNHGIPELASVKIWLTLVQLSLLDEMVSRGKGVYSNELNEQVAQFKQDNFDDPDTLIKVREGMSQVFRDFIRDNPRIPDEVKQMYTERIHITFEEDAS